LWEGASEVPSSINLENFFGPPSGLYWMVDQLDAKSVNSIDCPTIRVVKEYAEFG
jgi:hypothetical protein